MGLHVVNGFGQGSSPMGDGPFPGSQIPRLLGGGVLATNEKFQRLVSNFELILMISKLKRKISTS